MAQADPLMRNFVDLMQCPVSGEMLALEPDRLVSATGSHAYGISQTGIPLFAEKFASEAGRKQALHYDRIAKAYIENLDYPHTQAYFAHLDKAFLDLLPAGDLGVAVEVCCGQGEAFDLIGERVTRGVGVDISVSMLEAAGRKFGHLPIAFVQGDATMMPLQDGIADNVFVLGGVHHVPDRDKMFREIYRILKPGGSLYFREPVSDFFLWRWIRAVVYRLAPALDHESERPLVFEETVPVLKRAGFSEPLWKTVGFWGFCLFMNSDVLVFNKLFRFVPHIRKIVDWSWAVDNFTLRLPGMSDAGLQVVCHAQKPLV